MGHVSVYPNRIKMLTLTFHKGRKLHACKFHQLIPLRLYVVSPLDFTKSPIPVLLLACNGALVNSSGLFLTLNGVLVRRSELSLDLSGLLLIASGLLCSSSALHPSSRNPLLASSSREHSLVEESWRNKTKAWRSAACRSECVSATFSDDGLLLVHCRITVHL